MKLIVFGSTGSIGRELVNQALSLGHIVTAFARNPDMLDINHKKLVTVRGDVMDVTSIESAIQNQEVVLSALGTPARTKNNVRSVGTANIIKAMERFGIRRLICLSSIGIGDSRNMLPGLYKYLLVPLFLRQGFAEHEIQEVTVQRSRTDWTIVRPGAFKNGARTGNYFHGLPEPGRKIKAQISRADVADFMLSQLSETRYINKSPWVSY